MGVNRRALNNLLRVWNLVKGVTGDDLARMQATGGRLAVAGSPENRQWVKARFGASESVAEYAAVREARDSGEKMILNADIDTLRTEMGFAAAIEALAKANPESRIGLAAHYPVFRPVVVDQLTREYARKNGRLAAISALPGIIPILDWMLPATAAGDMLALTRNQITLLLEISACYNLPPNPRDRLTELIPVVGSAFGWRMVAREVIGLVPGGVGVAVKAGVAYAGTFAVGRAAAYYYASGQSRQLDLAAVYRRTLQEAIMRGRSMLPGHAPSEPAMMP